MRSIEWVGSSRRDLMALPLEVRREFGHALWLAQSGEMPRAAKPLSVFGGAQVVEIVEDEGGDTFRAIYTVRFAGVVYVLHVFQKKSRRGVATPKHEMDVVKARLKLAAAHHHRTHDGDGS
ncbi:type II toxin-antitoxin system RelE/ParE family toxin [Salinarimonas sp. NSM]|uniref:type II toxin-antitoxin system RelE/ParE family toxin n=1 Tax=Salinarimonas sp. NSM TaxID=3458003 RepID=UPI004036C7AD